MSVTVSIILIFLLANERLRSCSHHIFLSANKPNTIQIHEVLLQLPSVSRQIYTCRVWHCKPCHKQIYTCGAWHCKPCHKQIYTCRISHCEPCHKLIYTCSIKSDIVSSIQFSPLIDWVVGGLEKRFRGDPLPVCSAGSPCEEFWHGQGRRLLDVVHPAFSLPS